MPSRRCSLPSSPGRPRRPTDRTPSLSSFYLYSLFLYLFLSLSVSRSYPYSSTLSSLQLNLDTFRRPKSISMRISCSRGDPRDSRKIRPTSASLFLSLSLSLCSPPALSLPLRFVRGFPKLVRASRAQEVVVRRYSAQYYIETPTAIRDPVRSCSILLVCMCRGGVCVYVCVRCVCALERRRRRRRDDDDGSRRHRARSRFYSRKGTSPSRESRRRGFAWK